ncbi:hypothetical protein IGI04_023209, partial [Brassica rapa subsp. trilocularis]
EMVQIPVVYGEWVVKGSLWEFVVNNRKGGRMFLVSDGCTHGELHEMTLEDYGVDKKIEKVELTYSLPDVILQQMAPDTPPMHVMNDRQVRNLIDNFADEDTGQDIDSEWDEDSNDADDVQATADDVQATVDVAVDVDDGVNYSDYEKVKDEDFDEDANETLYDGYKAQFSGGEGRLLSLKDNIYVGQSFASKAELVSKLKSVAVEYKFTFSAYKTTKTLYVAKCRVQGCGWKLRASVKHGPKTFWWRIEWLNKNILLRNIRGVENLLAIREEYADMMNVERIDAPNTDDTSPANEEEAPNTDDPTPANEERADKPRKCLPPEVKRGRGRQKKSRWQSWLEISRMKGNQPRKLHKDYSFSQCKQPGHTRPNCPERRLLL